MSFSSEVRHELLQVDPGVRHCRIAEIRAFIKILGYSLVNPDGRGDVLLFQTENRSAAQKLFTLLKKTFNMNIVVQNGPVTRARQVWTIRTEDPEKTGDVLMAAGHPTVLSRECCRRSYLRGAFLAAGSVSAPEKYYHLEIVCPDEPSADEVRETMNSLGLSARCVTRKGDFVVYLKEGSQIVDLLGEMGASQSFLNIENIRVFREVRGNVNRKVNCETSNLRRTAVSAVRQIEDIRYIKEHAGFASLTPGLREMAEVRLRYPDLALAELGNMLDPRLGKSGVNHRLRRLSDIAEELRQKEKTRPSQDEGKDA